MSGETKALVMCVGIVALAAVLMVSLYHKFQADITKTALEAGYDQQSLPGETGVFWVKPNGGNSGNSIGETENKNM